MSLRDAARQLRQIADRLPKEGRRAVEKTQQYALKRAHELSSGTMTAADMRRMDYPFAVRHEEPLLDPTVINRRTGAFDEGWNTPEPDDTAGDTITGVLENTTKEASFLDQEDPPSEGKSKMVRRPIKDRIAAETEPVFQRRAEQAVARALSD